MSGVLLYSYNDSQVRLGEINCYGRTIRFDVRAALRFVQKGPARTLRAGPSPVVS